jgi:uncharacterized membrane protein (UPF0127 family)
MPTRRKFLAVLSLCLFLCPLIAAANGKLSRLSITGQTGTTYFDVELALTSQEQATGLMHRRHLPAGQGMLFVYGRVQEAAFWMKNTLIPLDMIFIDAGGRIVFIHEMAEPLSLAPIGPDLPIKAVLEINGGLTRQLGIRAGDRVSHPSLTAH